MAFNVLLKWYLYRSANFRISLNLVLYFSVKTVQKGVDHLLKLTAEMFFMPGNSFVTRQWQSEKIETNGE